MLKHSPAVGPLHIVITWTDHPQPMLERNIKEHHAFSHAMDATWLYLRKCRALLQPTPRPSPIPEPPADVNEIDLGQFGLDPAAGFNPQALRKHMDSWMLALAKHLADEIDTLTPEYIISVGKDNITQINKDVVKHLQSYDPTWFLCSTYCKCSSGTDTGTRDSMWDMSLLADVDCQHSECTSRSGQRALATALVCPQVAHSSTLVRLFALYEVETDTLVVCIRSQIRWMLEILCSS